MKHNSKELSLLDIPIKKNENSQITTDIYHKPTDTQQYFHFNSHFTKTVQNPSLTLENMEYTP